MAVSRSRQNGHTLSPNNLIHTAFLVNNGPKSSESPTGTNFAVRLKQNFVTEEWNVSL